MCSAAPVYVNATGYIRSAGDIRKLKMNNSLEEIDQEILNKEQELIAEELKNSGKTEEIAKKISLGKINKFKDDSSLMTQDWVMEPKKR